MRLDAFFEQSSAGDRLVGCYLWPHRLVGPVDFSSPESATSVAWVITSREYEVLLTRNGGLFVRPPEDLLDALGPKADASIGQELQQKLEFEQDVAEAFNLVICELALAGIVSEPAAPVYISRGELIEGHALITSASGGRELYLERNLRPSQELIDGSWRILSKVEVGSIDQFSSLPKARKVDLISPIAPTLVAGAYSLYSRQQYAEALIDSWIVIEQFLHYEYARNELKRNEGNRRRKGRDLPKASIVLSQLRRRNWIDKDLGRLIGRAEDHRNRLAHRARLDFTASKETMMTLHAVLEYVCDSSVAYPDTARGVNW